MIDRVTELFTDAFARWLRGFGIVYGFRRPAMLLLAAGRDVLPTDHQRLAQELTTAPTWARIWNNAEEVADPAFQAQLAESLTESALQTVRGGIDSACIIFAHSIVDSAAFDYCQVTALAEPHDWEPDLQLRQVLLGELKQRTYDEILNDRLQKFLQDLEKESLMKKLDRLHARCAPPPGWSIGDYQYAPTRVEAFDQLRQQVVHGDSMGQVVQGLDDELSYIDRTCAYMMSLVNMRYGVRIELGSVEPTVDRTPALTLRSLCRDLRSNALRNLALLRT